MDADCATFRLGVAQWHGGNGLIAWIWRCRYVTGGSIEDILTAETVIPPTPLLRVTLSEMPIQALH
jgi:hypothetical protein